MMSLKYPAGVKPRIFGSDTPFLDALRNHPRFQNRINPDTGISATDCDVIVCNFKHQSLKDLACLQIIEVKSRNAEPDFPQTSTYRVLNSFRGKKNGMIFYGVSFISYSGETFENSNSFRWGRFAESGRIYWRAVHREAVFDLATMLRHPDTLTNRVMFKSHHGSRSLVMLSETSLGFQTPIIIQKRY